MKYEDTERLLRAPWLTGTLARDFNYKGNHPEGEKVTWRIYHNDPDYISVRLFDDDGTVIVEFTETYELVNEASRIAAITVATYTIEKIYTERECYHDHTSHWPCMVPEIWWHAINDTTGEVSDYRLKGDAVAHVARKGGTISEVITWS